MADDQLEELLPTLQIFRTQLGEKISVEDWIAHVGTIEVALAYTRFFWPPFVQVEDMVFLEAGYKLQSLEDWKVAVGENPADIERHLNHTGLAEMFANPEIQQQLQPEQLHYFGQTLQTLWSLKLQQEFPQRQYKVQMGEGTSVEDYFITFYRTEQG